MTTKSKGNSVRQRLVTLAEKLVVPYRNIETAFLIERLVVRIIADKNLNRHLVFKGGFVGLRVYNSHRYTVDLDALLVLATVFIPLKSIFHPSSRQAFFPSLNLHGIITI